MMAIMINKGRTEDSENAINSFFLELSPTRGLDNMARVSAFLKTVCRLFRLACFRVRSSPRAQL
jgi:hypothetical protein